MSQHSKVLFIIHNTLRLHISAYGHHLTTAIEFCNSYFLSYGLVDPLPECQTETTVLHSTQIIFFIAFYGKHQHVYRNAKLWSLRPPSGSFVELQKQTDMTYGKKTTTNGSESYTLHTLFISKEIESCHCIAMQLLSMSNSDVRTL